LYSRLLIFFFSRPPHHLRAEGNEHQDARKERQSDATISQSEDRLRDYDHFGLAILDLFPYETSMGVGLSSGETVLNSRLDIDALEAYSSSSSLIISLTFIMTIIFTMIVFYHYILCYFF